MTTSTPSSPTKLRIVIAGAGFGGIRAARFLSSHPQLDVTVISPDDTFAYYPQLYHAATGGARSESALPLADLFEGRRVNLVKAHITKVDPDTRTVTTDTKQSLKYDKLIIGLGSVTNYFGIAGLPEFSFNIKTIAGAEEFKAHLHRQLVEDKHTDLHYVIVGGGPTGVELAGSLSNYLERIVKLHKIKRPKYKIDLVEAAPRLLPRSPEDMATKVQKRLESLGVNVMTSATVEAETADTLQLKGKDIKTKTVVWTAGVANNPFFQDNAAHFTLVKPGKVQVNDRLEARDGIYVIGDNASTKFSGMAQTALHDADFVVSDIGAQLSGGLRPIYRPKAPISVIPVGENWAAVLWGPVRLYGIIGWVLRRLADLIAYADVESWPKAMRVWLQDTKQEDGCRVCQPAQQAAI